jgi:hypothetical protein
MDVIRGITTKKYDDFHSENDKRKAILLSIVDQLETPINTSMKNVTNVLDSDILIVKNTIEQRKQKLKPLIVPMEEQYYEQNSEVKTTNANDENANGNENVKTIVNNVKEMIKKWKNEHNGTNVGGNNNSSTNVSGNDSTSNIVSPNVSGEIPQITITPVYFSSDGERLYYNCGNNKIIAIKIHSDFNGVTLDSLRSVEVVPQNGYEYLRCDCVCYMLSEQWGDFQNRIIQSGGQITQKQIQISMTETNPQCVIMGTRQQFGLQSDGLIILPISIYQQYNQYALVFADPFTRGNLFDVVVVSVTKV